MLRMQMHMFLHSRNTTSTERGCQPTRANSRGGQSPSPRNSDVFSFFHLDSCRCVKLVTCVGRGAVDLTRLQARIRWYICFCKGLILPVSFVLSLLPAEDMASRLCWVSDTLAARLAQSCCDSSSRVAKAQMSVYDDLFLLSRARHDHFFVICDRSERLHLVCSQ